LIAALSRAGACNHARRATGTSFAMSWSTVRTLIADDDLIITTILSSAVTRLGMQVTVAHDGTSHGRR